MALVLIVDDEPDIRHLLKVNLELDGHEVLTAGNGAEALAVVRHRVPDLMILDVVMPRVDGWRVLQSVKADAGVDVGTIPVLLLTGVDDPEARARGGIEGAIRYLTKPFSTEQVRLEVREALQGEPEPVKRRKAQQAALQQLARMEKGDEAPSAAGVDAPRPRLTRLERPPAPPPRPTSPQSLAVQQRLGELTPKQLDLLARLAGAPSVSEAAGALHMSRSNVYASLRRISRKLGVVSVPELLAVVRRGDLFRPSG